MKLKIAILIFAFVILLSTILHAQSSDKSYNILLVLKDINTNENIGGGTLYLISDQLKINQYIEDDEIFKYNLADGVYSSIIKFDDPSTAGNDYFSAETLTVDGTLISDTYLFPVATIRGIVKDKLDNVVGNANLNFQCSGNINLDFPKSTDKFGTFSLDHLPVGSCRILAAHAGAVGLEEVEVKQGDLIDIEIKLNKTILAPKPRNDYLLIGILVIIIIGIVAYLVYSKKPGAKEGVKKVEKEEVKRERTKDIIQTLNNKEKEVVAFLINNNN